MKGDEGDEEDEGGPSPRIHTHKTSPEAPKTPKTPPEGPNHKKAFCVLVGGAGVVSKTIYTIAYNISIGGGMITPPKK